MTSNIGNDVSAADVRALYACIATPKRLRSLSADVRAELCERIDAALADPHATVWVFLDLLEIITRARRPDLRLVR